MLPGLVPLRGAGTGAAGRRCRPLTASGVTVLRSRLFTPAPRDPVADLRQLCSQLDQCRARREHAVATRINATIDRHLEQRGSILAAQAHAAGTPAYAGNGTDDRT